MNGKDEFLHKLEQRLPAELTPEDFVSTVSEVRKSSLLQWVTKVTILLFCFLVICTMGLYYLIGLGYVKLDPKLMSGLSKVTIGQVIVIILLIVRSLIHGPFRKGKPKKNT